MELPSVVHTKAFRIGGIFFEIVTAGPVSGQQAAKIAMRFYGSRKFRKSDKGKSFQVITLFDRDSAMML